MQESFLQFLMENIQIFLSYTGFANATSGHFVMLLVGLIFNGKGQGQNFYIQLLHHGGGQIGGGIGDNDKLAHFRCNPPV